MTNANNESSEKDKKEPSPTEDTKNPITQLFTGKDNQTQDIARWLVAAAFLVALSLQIYDVVGLGHQFDLQQFGIGIASLFAGFGTAIKLKENSEPSRPN